MNDKCENISIRLQRRGSRYGVRLSGSYKEDSKTTVLWRGSWHNFKTKEKALRFMSRYIPLDNTDTKCRVVNEITP